MSKVNEVVKEEKQGKKNREDLITRFVLTNGKVKKLKLDVASDEKALSLGKKVDKKALTLKRKKLEDLKKEASEVKKMLSSLKGGKLKASLMKKFFEESHEKSFNDIGDYKIDKTLSNEFVKVYHNSKDDWTVVVHRGTKTSFDKAGLDDVITDAQLLVNFKKNPRFKISLKTQKNAEKKYDPRRMSSIGSSLGGVLAQDSAGPDVFEVITSGKPTLPVDVITRNKPRDNQFDVRTSTDPVSMLKPLLKHKNDVQVKSIDPTNPIKSHLGGTTMESVMKERGEDIKIGRGFAKLKIKDLKEFIKANRKLNGGCCAFPVTGKCKNDLVIMAQQLENLNR